MTVFILRTLIISAVVGWVIANFKSLRSMLYYVGSCGRDMAEGYADMITGFVTCGRKWPFRSVDHNGAQFFGHIFGIVTLIVFGLLAFLVLVL